MHLTLIPSQIEAAPSAWRKAAEDYRRVNPNSAEAAAFEYVANDLEARIAEAKASTKRLTVPEYAKRCGANPATVRKWIYRGELEATQDERGEWMIPASAQRVRHGRQGVKAS